MHQISTKHAEGKLCSLSLADVNLSLRSLRPSRISRARTINMYATALVLMICGTAFGQDHYRIEPDHSEVHFSLAGTGHEVHGLFHVSSGEIGFDRKTGEMKGTVVVDAARGSSDNNSRDKKMTNEELKATAFPSITFAPTRFTGTLKDTGDSSVQVEGTFTLLGQPHVINVPMMVHIEGDQCIASGSFVVPYVSWGMKDPSVFMLKVAKEVKIDLKLAGSLKQ